MEQSETSFRHWAVCELRKPGHGKLSRRYKNGRECGLALPSGKCLYFIPFFLRVLRKLESILHNTLVPFFFLLRFFFSLFHSFSLWLSSFTRNVLCITDSYFHRQDSVFVSNPIDAIPLTRFPFSFAVRFPFCFPFFIWLFSSLLFPS